MQPVPDDVPLAVRRWDALIRRCHLQREHEFVHAWTKVRFRHEELANVDMSIRRYVWLDVKIRTVVVHVTQHQHTGRLARRWTGCDCGLYLGGERTFADRVHSRYTIQISCVSSSRAIVETRLGYGCNLRERRARSAPINPVSGDARSAAVRRQPGKVHDGITRHQRRVESWCCRRRRLDWIELSKHATSATLSCNHA